MVQRLWIDKRAHYFVEGFLAIPKVKQKSPQLGRVRVWSNPNKDTFMLVYVDVSFEGSSDSSKRTLHFLDEQKESKQMS